MPKVSEDKESRRLFFIKFRIREGHEYCPFDREELAIDWICDLLHKMNEWDGYDVDIRFNILINNYHFVHLIASDSVYVYLKFCDTGIFNARDFHFEAKEVPNRREGGV